MKHLMLVIALGLLVSCNNNIKNTNTSETTNTKTMETKTLSQKEKATAILTSLETGDKTPISYINPTKYVQHNLAVADGLEGFGEVMKHAPKDGFKAKVVRAFEDGDYAFTHTIYDFFGPKIGFDIFKFENDKVVEHWDNLIDVAPANPSGHSQVDGATTITDLDKTEANKALVKDFIDTVLVNGNFNELGNYFNGDNYIQHNPMVGDGLSGLGKALEGMAKNGIEMIYETNHIILGEGNFVLAVSEGTFGEQHTSYYDLFRIENGKIAEHWDVIETIAPKDTWKNNNGKFNF